MPDTPGAFFFGAKITPEAFGLTEHGSKATGAGGRGFSLGTAFESCMGETAEYLSFLERDNDQLATSSPVDVEFGSETLQWIKCGLGVELPEQLQALDCVISQSLNSNRKIPLPLELVLRRPLNRRWSSRPAHSNGVATSVTLQAAIRAALLEVIERDAMVLWWYGGDDPHAVLQGHHWGADFQDRIHACRRHSDRACWFLDITSDIGIPVIAAFSSKPDGSEVVGGFAADTDPRVAASRAFLEMCQMELAQKISSDKKTYLPDAQLSEQDRIWIERQAHLSLENRPRLKLAKSGGKEPPGLRSTHSTDPLEAISKAGFEAFFVDLTRSEINVPCARVLIPGLQPTDPTWRTDRLSATAARNSFEIGKVQERISPF